MTSSTEAELSTISTQIEEILDRTTRLGDQYRLTPDSQFVGECNSAERNLMSALRAIERAKKQIS